MRRDGQVWAEELLSAAIRDGTLVAGPHVGAERYPQAARTYLSDGTGLAWSPPTTLGQEAARFVIDAEIPAPVRPILARRYGITDPLRFARAWTRAEVWAKLFDVPIVTWLSRYGLDEPLRVTQAIQLRRLAISTTVERAVVTRGVLLDEARGLKARHPGVVGGAH